jgi:lipopolysaccharide export system protein LptA
MKKKSNIYAAAILGGMLSSVLILAASSIAHAQANAVVTPDQTSAATASQASAQSAPQNNVAPPAPEATQEETPLEITADQSLQWNQNQKSYTARGRAQAQQGDMTLNAETLEAFYREGATSSNEIFEMIATDNVKIVSQGHTAYGDKVIYNVDNATAIMTGKNLLMESEGQTVTARDQFVYHTDSGKLIAKGQAVATRAQDKITADELAAIFSTPSKTSGDKIQKPKSLGATDTNSTSKRQLDTITATGNVVITTPTEIITGSHGIYDAKTNKATLTGHVVIKRDQHVLEGEKAIVDMNTHISELTGGNIHTGGRVRGVFYPAAEKSKKDAQQ